MDALQIDARASSRDPAVETAAGSGQDIESCVNADSPWPGIETRSLAALKRRAEEDRRRAFSEPP